MPVTTRRSGVPSTTPVQSPAPETEAAKEPPWRDPVSAVTLLSSDFEQVYEFLDFVQIPSRQKMEFKICRIAKL